MNRTFFVGFSPFHLLHPKYLRQQAAVLSQVFNVRLLQVSLLLLCFETAIRAGSVAYVVVRNSPQDSLVRVSADGASITTIANGAAGVGLAIDHAGNYVVAARSALLRVTRSGVVSTIASAPAGSEWIAVVADPKGHFIAADYQQHTLWRVSEDGQSVTEFVKYPGDSPPNGSDIGLMVDRSGDYLLLRIGEDSAPVFYRVTPTGSILRVPLRGDVAPSRTWFRPPHGRPKAEAGGPIIPDGSGGYLFLDDEITENIFRLSATAVTKFAYIGDAKPRFRRHPTGLARNPATGEVIVSTQFSTVASERRRIDDEYFQLRSKAPLRQGHHPGL